MFENKNVNTVDWSYLNKVLAELGQLYLYEINTLINGTALILALYFHRNTR